MCCTWCLPHGHKHKIFNSHAIKQMLHGSWNTIHSRCDMHTQQKNVHACYQQSRGLSTCWVTAFQQNVAMFCILHYYICKKQRDILLIGDDSDLVCLSPLSDIGFKRIYFHTEPKWNIKVLRSYWDRLQVQQDFGKHINKHMLYVHAISSCDTHN